MGRKSGNRIGGAQQVQQKVDPKTEEWLSHGAKNPATETARQRYERERTRANLDIHPEVKAVLERIAAKERTSLSQTGALLLAWAVRDYLSDEHQRELRDVFYEGHILNPSPRCEFKIEIPDAWIEAFRTFLDNGEF